MGLLDFVAKDNYYIVKHGSLRGFVIAEDELHYLVERENKYDFAIEDAEKKKLLNNSYLDSYTSEMIPKKNVYYVDLNVNPNEYFSEESFHKVFMECQDCYRIVRKDDIISRVCRDCYNTASSCAICSKKIVPRVDISFEYDSGNYGFSDGYIAICHKCDKEDQDKSPEDALIGWCAFCGCVFLKKHLLLDDEGTYYCLDCKSTMEKEKKKMVKSYHYHKSASPVFFGANKNDDALFLGVELEIDAKEETGVTITEKNELSEKIKAVFPDKFIYFESDGSLHNGIENITQPATFEFHLSQTENYKKMFRLARKAGFISHKAKTCGLHVHFNRSFYADNEELYITRLLYIAEKFWDELLIYSRRTPSTLNYSKRYNDSPEDVIKKMKNHDIERYMAINLTNRNTIEFRIFRGTLNINTFLATLELVNTLVYTARDYSIDEIQKMKWEDFLKTDITKEYWKVSLEREKTRKEARERRRKEREERKK